MPPERLRTSNHQGRQKSCAECVKAKRKCDLQQPNCLRCTKQRLTCTYPPPPRTATVASTSPDSDETLIDSLFDDPGFELPFDLDIAMAPDVVAAPDVELLESVADFSGPMNNLERTNNALRSFGGAKAHPVPTRIERFPSAKTFSDLIASELFESRVGYSLEQWKLAPRMMVEMNCTPWSHPNLYEEIMPRSMQDAFAACALYNSRTEANAKFVLRHITERASELVDQPIPTLPAEVIARAHAALLYQVMLICSEDIRYYGQTHTLLPHLRDLSHSLYTIVLQDQSKHEDHSGSLPLYPSSAARMAWLSFIFRESCRRTLLAVCQAVSICTLLQGDFYSCNDAMAIGNRVTISAALWEAKSPLEFAIAWNEKNHYLVKELNFTEVLRSAGAKDVDVFGRMMMIGLMGKDDVSAWLHSKGGKL
ncbi:hypothetical protein BU23DRAFT_498562 [Bimuria novae-zelandiae CBS 107.79]|uniref:Zn(2)-C6 fungal-type domain-containing protein n=1 Tax=Bimuria novae-zelandiae CBS 107.79 TaxID=1447943 RepID=A0A6A5VS06_9PLEO|nr:hypothetical protein BU23DRAFT_498562 [Bimuria novae-zelandiae CBS 107.79]